MTHHAKITSKGLMTLPAAIRAELGVKPGDRVQLERLPDGRIALSPAPPPLASLRGIIDLGRPVSTEEIVRMTRMARDGRGMHHLDALAGRRSGEGDPDA